MPPSRLAVKLRQMLTFSCTCCELSVPLAMACHVRSCAHLTRWCGSMADKGRVTAPWHLAQTMMLREAARNTKC